MFEFDPNLQYMLPAHFGCAWPEKSPPLYLDTTTWEKKPLRALR